MHISRFVLPALSGTLVLTLACSTASPGPTPPATTEAPPATTEAPPAVPSALVSTPTAGAITAPSPSAAVSLSPSALASPSPLASPSAAAGAANGLQTAFASVPKITTVPAPLGVPASGPISLSGAYAQTSDVQGVLYVAADGGYFQQNGLNVNLSLITGTSQVAALGANEIQFAALGANEVTSADAEGQDFVMIATCSDLPIFSLFAAKQYTSIPQLAGQQVGVTTAGSATDAAAHFFLTYYGVANEVTTTPAGGTIPAILASIQQNVLPAGILSPPATQTARDAGLNELANGATLGVPLNHSAIAVSQKYAQQNPDAVHRFVNAYVEAWAYAADPANRDAVITILTHYTKSTPDQEAVGYTDLQRVWSTTSPVENPAAVANVIALSTSPKVAGTSPSQYIDDGPIDAVLSAS